MNANINKQNDPEVSIRKEAFPVIEEVDIRRLFYSELPLRISLYHTGLDKHQRLSFVRHCLHEVEHEKNMKSLLSKLKSVKSQLLESGLFKSIHYSVEPAKELCNNAIVRLDVVESNGRKEIGIHTDMKGKPEVKISMANVLNKACTIAFECMPTKLSQGMTSVKSNFQWYNPILGRLLEVSWTQGTHDHHALHAVDTENRQVFAAAAHFGPAYNRHTVSATNTVSLLSSSEPHSVCTHLEQFHGTTRARAGLQYERIINALRYHSNPFLRTIYAHPVQGYDLRLRGGLYSVDVRKSLESAHNARKSRLGSFCTGTKELRLESFFASHFLLHPLLTLGLWGKLGVFFPITPRDPPEHAAYPYLLDRFFLGSSHVRGYAFVGPSVRNQTKYNSVKEYFYASSSDATAQINQLGGSLYAAFSSSLSFPVPLAGGLAAGHVFLNTGYVNDIQPSSGQKAHSLREWARLWCTSCGTGLIVNQIPGLGTFSCGRLEVNLSYPLLGFMSVESEEDGHRQESTRFPEKHKDIFRKVKFGVHWSYE